ncbi:hypothetical protein M0R45_002682 [Rubus argutus]|uniref:Uncharacterized protein n=1 Tax=Rubus argutus TaxID=59490 RepID=A0AAW1VPQ9_RUBAR
MMRLRTGVSGDTGKGSDLGTPRGEARWWQWRGEVVDAAREKEATPATWLWSHGEGGATGLGTAAVMAARVGQNWDFGKKCHAPPPDPQLPFRASSRTRLCTLQPLIARILDPSEQPLCDLRVDTRSTALGLLHASSPTLATISGLGINMVKPSGHLRCNHCIRSASIYFLTPPLQLRHNRQPGAEPPANLLDPGMQFLIRALSLTCILFRAFMFTHQLHIGRLFYPDLFCFGHHNSITHCQQAKYLLASYLSHY